MYAGFGLIRPITGGLHKERFVLKIHTLRSEKLKRFELRIINIWHFKSFVLILQFVTNKSIPHVYENKFLLCSLDYHLSDSRLLWIARQFFYYCPINNFCAVVDTE